MRLREAKEWLQHPNTVQFFKYLEERIDWLKRMPADECYVAGDPQATQDALARNIGRILELINVYDISAGGGIFDECFGREAA